MLTVSPRIVRLELRATCRSSTNRPSAMRAVSGMIAARNGEASFRMVRLAVECLERLDHRGAKAADGTGDGAGLLTEIPFELFARELRNRGYACPRP